MKATEQYFLVVLFIRLCKMVLNIESVDKILKCEQSKWIKVVLTGQMCPKRTNFEASYQLCSKLWLPYPKVIFTVESEFEMKNVNFLSERCEN